MLKIKLARFGKKNQPHYRIVVNEARDKRDGSYVALLGQYVPAQQPKVLEIDMDAYNEWIKKGAQPTETVAALAKRYESGNPFPEKKAKLSKKAQAKLAEEAKKAEEEKAAEETKEEAPAAETTPEAETEKTEEKAQ
jgi:small subunit ribosomal protein S16